MNFLNKLEKRNSRDLFVFRYNVVYLFFDLCVCAPKDFHFYYYAFSAVPDRKECINFKNSFVSICLRVYEEIPPYRLETWPWEKN